MQIRNKRYRWKERWTAREMERDKVEKEDREKRRRGKGQKQETRGKRI